MENIIMPELTESQKVNLNLITVNTAVNDLQTDVRELNKIVLLGNGEVALRETVRADHAFILEIRYWLKFIMGLGIAGFISNAIIIALWMIKQMP